jgi:hypothetical protein
MLWKGEHHYNKEILLLKLLIIVLLQILLLLQVVIKEMNKYDFALVNWYDFKNSKHKFSCPYLERTDNFTLIPIETIDNIVHIVKRFCRQNAYFVNCYLF